MKKINILIIVFLFFIFLFLNNCIAQIYLGTVEGYIFYQNGSLASDALVTVIVRNCQAPNQYCIRQTYSQSNGYYVITNLALEPHGYIDVKAEKSNWFGSNSGEADDYRVAFINVTMCLAPTKPTLQKIENFHPLNKTYYVIFNWTSGKDENNLSIYDMFYIDGNWEFPVNPPITRLNLPFGFHLWGVRTCNDLCCSEISLDNFTIINNPPPKPTLIDQKDNTTNTLIFEWLNVTDPDGDEVFYDFMIDDEIRKNVTSPQIVEGINYGYHEWKVRACDLFECSDWSIDSFNIINKPCPKPNIKKIENICNVPSIIFSWESEKIDEEGHKCYDEFMINNIIIDRNATSPKNLTFTATQIIEWGVRSCDEYKSCSEWNKDSFIYCICEYREKPISGGVSGGWGGRIGECVIKEAKSVKGYELFILAPKNIYQGDEFLIEINFFPLENYNNSVLRIENNWPLYFNFENLEYNLSNVEKGKEIKIIIKIINNRNTPKGIYDFFISLYYQNNTRLFYKKINIEVEELPKIIKILPIEKIKYKTICCLWLILLILFICLLTIIWLIYKIYKNIRKNERTDKSRKNT